VKLDLSSACNVRRWFVFELAACEREFTVRLGDSDPGAGAVALDRVAPSAICAALS